MSRRILSEYVLGNIFIEAIEKEKYSLTINDIMKFDDYLYSRLNKINSFSDLKMDDIFMTIEKYPYFFKIDNDSILLNFKKEDKNLLKRLTRSFRIGLPKDIIEIFTDTANSFLFK